MKGTGVFKETNWESACESPRCHWPIRHLRRRRFSRHHCSVLRRYWARACFFRLHCFIIWAGLVFLGNVVKVGAVAAIHSSTLCADRIGSYRQLILHLSLNYLYWPGKGRILSSCVIVNGLLVVLTLQFLCHLMNNIFLKTFASERQKGASPSIEETLCWRNINSLWWWASKLKWSHIWIIARVCNFL